MHGALMDSLPASTTEGVALTKLSTNCNCRVRCRGALYADLVAVLALGSTTDPVQTPISLDKGHIVSYISAKCET